MRITKYISLVFTLLMSVMMSTSCTHNNGDIGKWFGEWQLRSIEVNGTDDADYQGNILWKFQNNIIEMVSVTGHTQTEHFGTWSDSDKELTLNFTHHDDNNPAGSDRYAPPSVTRLPAAIVTLKIVKLSSSEIILQYAPDSSTLIVYTLRKRG